MFRNLTIVLLVILPAWPGAAVPQERGREPGGEGPPYKLSDLKVNLDGGSAIINTFGRFTAQPVLRLKLKARGQKWKPVFLEKADNAGDFAKKAEAFRYAPILNEKGKYRVLFKSKELRARVGDYRGPLNVEAQVFIAEKVDGEWQVDPDSALSDAARTTLTIK